MALGIVGWLYDLRRLGFITETKTRGRVYENRAGLIDRWVEAYAHQLRPAIKPQRYRVADETGGGKKISRSSICGWLGSRRPRS